MKRSVAMPAVILIGILLFSACNSNQLNVVEVRGHADQTAERMMQALSHDNYLEFSSDFDQEMRVRLPEAEFHSYSSSIKQTWGNYVSKEYFTVIKNQNSVSVLYYLNFDGKKPGPTMQIDFKNVDGSGPVTGFSIEALKSR